MPPLGIRAKRGQIGYDFASRLGLPASHIQHHCEEETDEQQL
jgi:hypothetical protein